MALEKTILRGLGLPRILEAANSVVQTMLLHFIHEEQFIGEFALSKFQQRQRDADIEVIAQLFAIEDGIEQAKAAAVFQLLLLGRVWIKEHMHLESGEFECESLKEESPFLLREAFADDLPAIAKTGSHDHRLPGLRHLHLSGECSPQSAPGLNG
jgi:hypothetical protein